MSNEREKLLGSQYHKDGTNLGRNAQISDLVQQLKKKNKMLERMLAKLGTNADTPQFQERLASAQKEAKNLCQSIISKIRQATDSSGGSAIRKDSQLFQKELQKFTKITKDIEKAESAFVEKISNSYQKGSVMDDSNDMTAEEQQISQQFQSYDIEEIRNRTEQIKHIERDVVELHDMFNDLKLLVDEQQEGIDVIENNVTDARDQTFGANQELLEADRLQKKARKKQCCMLVLILIILGAVVAMVMILKK